MHFLEKILNFNTPGMNPYLLKERAKKLIEVQTDEEFAKIPPELTLFFEQDKLEKAGRSELTCLFEFFDP